MGFSGATPRPSNLTNAEIYSLQSSRNPTPRGSSFNHNDFYSMVGVAGRSSNFGAADVFGPVVATSRGPTPRPSNYYEEDNAAAGTGGGSGKAAAAAAAGAKFGPNSYQLPVTAPSTAATQPAYPTPNPGVFSPTAAAPKANTRKGPATGAPNGGITRGTDPDGAARDLHMFVWSSSASPVSDVFGNHQEYGVAAPEMLAKSGADVRRDEYMEREDFSFGNRGAGKDGKPDQPVYNGSTKALIDEAGKGIDDGAGGAGGAGAGAATSTPPASVMTRLILIMVWRKLIRNPNTYSSLFGLVWSLVSFRFHVEMPAIIAKSISILSDAGLGMAMFSLGLFMALQPRIIACGNSLATYAMAVRFLAGPAVMAAASFIIGLRGVLLRVAIVQAALPQGIVPFVFAKEYNLHPQILSTAVIFGMLIALPIDLIYYIVLGI